MLTTDMPSPSREMDLPGGDRLGLGPKWEITQSPDRHFEIRHRDRGTPYHPTARPHSWAGLLDRLEDSFRAAGVARARPLPTRWGRDTELTISAVQALDPLLKDGEPYVLRRGYLPQPVVRLTGERDGTGDLRDGFLTSFVNVSRIEPITQKAGFTGILDHWLTALSDIGLHARHITIHGRNELWRRREVCGRTVHFRHLDLPIGDIVLLWNAAIPAAWRWTWAPDSNASRGQAPADHGGSWSSATSPRRARRPTCLTPSGPPPSLSAAA